MRVFIGTVNKNRTLPTKRTIGVNHKMDLEIVNFCGINIVNSTRYDFTEFFIDECTQKKSNRPKLCFSLNGESLAEYHHNKTFKNLFNYADYVHADGQSIVNASKFILKKSLPERIATTDWFHDVAKLSEKKGTRNYFVGGKESTLNKAISNIKMLYPKLIIAGYHHGYFNKHEESQIIADINKSETDILWLSLGRPLQEITAIRWERQLSTCTWIKTCGGLFDFLSLEKPRAPAFMQTMNLEWIYRLKLEPRRLLPRYLRTNFQSLFIMLKYLILQR